MLSTNRTNHVKAMRHLIPDRLPAVLFSLVLIAFSPSISTAQRATLTDDAQTSTANPNQNFGSRVSVQVSGTTLKGFLKFNLTPNLPAGITGSQIEKATLKLFVSAVNTAGAADVYSVGGAWDEENITNNTAPLLGSLITSLPVDASNQNRWVTIDITSLVKDWLDNVLPNNGIALIAAPTGVNVTFNSKENGTTSHEPLLEILLSHVASADQATNANNATNAGHATTADNAVNATTAAIANELSSSATINGNQVNGALTNATIASTSLTGIVSIANGGTGSSTQNFVDLSTDQTIAGNKTFSDAVNTNMQYNLGGNRLISTAGTNNLFVGLGAGQANPTGAANAFFGRNAGVTTTTGFNNSFFGAFAGNSNTAGDNNSFFGAGSGRDDTIGSGNSFFGAGSGRNNITGNSNSFFGFFTGLSNQTGNANTYFGSQAGKNNVTGSNNSFFGGNAGLNNMASNNSFFGDAAGINNSAGAGNTFIGASAGLSNTGENNNTFIGFNANGTPGIANATAIGANSTVTTSNTLVLGTNAMTVQVPGNLNVSGTFTGSIPAGSGSYIQNTTDLQVGASFNISGDGTLAGTLSAASAKADVVKATSHYELGGFKIMSAQGSNTSVGASAGNVGGGSHSSFFGNSAGSQSSAGNNSFFGALAGAFTTTGQTNSFFGAFTGANNTTGEGNSFFGSNAGSQSSTGNNNTFVGIGTGQSNTTGSNNVFVGNIAGFSNTTEDNNTYIGAGSHGTPGVTNAVAIGWGAEVTQSNTMVLGTGNVTVQIPGNLNVANSFSANGSNLSNLNASNITSGTLDNARLDVVSIANGGTGSASQNFVDLSTNQTIAGSKSFNDGVTAGNSTAGGSLVLTNTVNRFLELGSNVGFDSVSGTVVGIRLKSTHPLENYSYGIFHGSNVFPGALIFRKDDESIVPGDLRNRLIIAGNGDLLVNPGSLGIGTPSPSEKLHVVGAAKIEGGLPDGTMLNMFKANPAERNFSMWSNPGMQWLAGLEPTGPDTVFRIRRNGGANAISINNSNNFIGLGVAATPNFPLDVAGNGNFRNDLYAQGNVGVGTTSPAFKLDVAGTGNFSEALRTGSHMRVEGNLFVQNSFPQVNLDNGVGQNLATFNATTGPGSTAAIGSVPGTAFVIRSGGIDSIAIDPNNQRVGVGTTTPNYRLDVNGIVNATDIYKNGAPLPASQWTSSGSNIHYDAGNVGIGTTTPVEKLDVGGNIFINSGGGGNVSYLAGSRFSSEVNALNQIEFFGADGIGLGLANNASQKNASVVVHPLGVSLSNLAGYFGILDSYSTHPRPSLFVNRLTTTSGPIVDFQRSNQSKFLIDNAGNVGIGTANPSGKLEISDAGSSIFRVTKTGTGAGSVDIINDGSQPRLFGPTGSNFYLGVTGDAVGAGLTLEAGGNVGIGTVAPTQKLEVVGNVRINGDFVATGTKSAVVTLADKREVTLYALESPGNWFEDFGSARLINGSVTVLLDPLFAQTVNTEFTYHVFLTANGNCRGLYVAKKTTTGFEVRELGGGRSNITFDYRIVARRKGYEKVTTQPR